MSTVPAPAGAKLNGLALSGFIVSLVGVVLLLTGWGGALFGLVGLILSFLGRRQLLVRGDRGAGLALAGIILGIIALVLGVVLTIVAVAIVGSHMTH